MSPQTRKTALKRITVREAETVRECASLVVTKVSSFAHSFSSAQKFLTSQRVSLDSENFTPVDTLHYDCRTTRRCPVASRHCDRGEGRDLASSALVCLSLFFLVVSSQEFFPDADHGGLRHARPNDNCYRDGTPRPSALRRNCYYCRYRQSTPPTIVAHALVVQVTAAAARKILHSLTPSQFLIDRSHGCYLREVSKELERGRASLPHMCTCSLPSCERA